jgi:hypothetical protein
MRKHLVLISVVLLGTAFVAQAGPPLICHPYNIGDAKSLPWIGGPNWDGVDPAYNVKNLANDTLAILDASPTVLVRMETMRRAVIYGGADHNAARELMARLKAREADAEKSAKPAATAYFDYGYFLASLKQVESWKYKEDMTGGIDGYPFVQKALAIDPESAEMHFAAAVMASSPPRPADREQHLQRARAAKNDSLLAQNLNTHFQ